MSIQNAFSIGPCQVQVANAQGGTQWQGTLALNGSSGNFTGYNGETLNAKVNSDGSVELDLVSGTFTYGYLLSVIPSYSMSTATQILVETITIADPGSNPLASSQYNGGTGVALTGSGSAYTPDPCDVTTHGNKSSFTLFQGVNV